MWKTFWIIGWLDCWMNMLVLSSSLSSRISVSSNTSTNPNPLPFVHFFFIVIVFWFFIEMIGTFCCSIPRKQYSVSGRRSIKKEKEIRNITHSYSNGIVYLYIITTATATARFCVKISWGLDSLIEDPHSVKKWFLDFTIPKKTCFLLSLK